MTRISSVRVVAWTFYVFACVTAGSSALATDLVVDSSVLFSALDGSASDEDGIANGILTLNSLVVTGSGEIVLEVSAADFVVSGNVRLEGNGAGLLEGVAQGVWPNARAASLDAQDGNVLNKLSKNKHGKAKGMLHDIWMARTRAQAHRAFGLFVDSYQAKYPEAVKCLTKDRDVLLAFYDSPAEQWMHIRTTNPIESTSATVRLRTKRTKGSGSRVACLATVFKLTMCAEKTWRALNGSTLLADVIRGVQSVDGIKQQAA